MWHILLQLKENVGFSCGQFAVLEAVLNHARIRCVRAAAVSHSEWYTNFSSGSVRIVIRLMTSSGIFIDPSQLAKVQPAD